MTRTQFAKYQFTMGAVAVEMNDYVSKIFITLLPPTLFFLLYFNDLILLETLRSFLVLYFVLCVLIPVIFRYNYTFQRCVVFLNNVNLPKWAQFNNPKKHGLIGTRNFYIQTDDGVNLGVWHVLPLCMIKDELSKEEEEEYFEKTLTRGPPVFIYLHGNASNRAAGHHIELHQILRKYYHVITFDYRGYGDSGGIPLKESLVIKDAITIMKWVMGLTPVNIFIWGHSLGSSVATHALRLLALEDIHVDGLVLESPFDNMRNEVSEHPMTVIFRQLPWFSYTIVDPIYNSGLLFSTDEHIKYIDCPVIFLHAEDDCVVPFKLGARLFSIASKNRRKTQGPIEFKNFSKQYGCGHKYICRAPELPNIVNAFVADCLKH